MIEIRALDAFTAAGLNQLAEPYTCHDTYRVVWQEGESGVRFELQRVPLETPQVRRHDHIDEDWVRQYLLPAGFSYGAYDGKRWVGALIAERRAWNDTLWVWEFMVAAAYRGQGIGRRLMEQAAAAARAAGLRAIECETQNRNGNAIAVYRRLGFHLEGINLFHYTETDYPDKDVAVFFKLHLI